MGIRENFDHYHAAMKQLVNDYYKQCPGSIIPLFLLYLARTGKPGKELIKIEEKIRKPLDWKDNPERRYSSEILSQFTQEDAAELAQKDPAGANLLERWKCNEMDHMSVVVFHTAGRIQQIREAFQKHDEVLVDSMDKRRAMFLFVQGLLQCPNDYLKEYYLDIANEILKHACVFNEFDDLSLARFEKWILGDIKGPVFIPFARAPFAASMLSSASVSTESCGPTADLASMVSELIIKGNGIKKITSVSVAKPYESIGDVKFDGVVLNYASHDEKTGYTSWHTCLKHIKNNLSEKGKFVGLIETKYLFRMVGKQKLFKEVIADNSLESVVLLPRHFGLALISVNKAKKHPSNVKMVNLFNEDIDCRSRELQRKVSLNSKIVSIDTLAKEQTTIESFFEEVVPEKEGFRLLPLGKVLNRYRKDSFFGVTDSACPDELMKVYIDREHPYSPYEHLASYQPIEAFSLFEPAYYLDTVSLIVNNEGELEPRIFRGDRHPAFFSEGLAFAISTRGVFPPYIINELRKPYVQTQLNHWSASKERRHSEDEIMDIKIYIPNSEDTFEAERSICEKELDSSILPEGFVVSDGRGTDYTIEKCLGSGGFGISYLAKESSFWDDDIQTVVLKEFFGRIDNGSTRFDGNQVAMSLGDIDSIRQETDLHSFLIKFIDEAETMEYFSRFKGCHVRGARSIFKCDETNTYYYVMDYYSRGTLEDELRANGPMNENEFIDRVMRPLAIALDTMHNNHWLHLDIKAENILIDDEGQAILGDLGISQHYDENGIITTKGGGVGSRGHCCRLQYDLDFTKQYHPELDIFSFAALMYYAFSGNDMQNYSPDDLDAPFIEISDKSKKALRKALDQNLRTTPKSVRDFMHMLPGCENMVFEDIQPVEVDLELTPEDLDPNDFEDLPYFT